MASLSVEKAVSLAQSMGIPVNHKKAFVRVGSADNSKPRLYIPLNKNTFTKADVSGFTMACGTDLGEKSFGRVKQRVDLTSAADEAGAIEIWNEALEGLKAAMEASAPATLAAPEAPKAEEPASPAALLDAELAQATGDVEIEPETESHETVEDAASES